MTTAHAKRTAWRLSTALSTLVRDLQAEDFCFAIVDAEAERASKLARHLSVAHRSDYPMDPALMVHDLVSLSSNDVVVLIAWAEQWRAWAEGCH